MSSENTLNGQLFIKPAKASRFHLGILPAIAIGMLLASIALLPVKGALSYYSVIAVQLILFFAFGNICISTQNFQKLYEPEKQGKNILLITSSLCVLLSAVYFFFKKDAWLMAFSSSAAFILPFFLKLCWYIFSSIPGKEFNTWFPNASVPEKPPVSLDSLLVRVKLTQYASDVEKKIYTVFIPQYIKLGDFFTRFLAEHNTHAASMIEDSDRKGNKCAWEFFEIGMYGLQSRRLDPALTMAENKIKKDALVFIKRLVQPAKLSSYNKSLMNETIK